MKPGNKAKLYARAESALQDLYHNATPNYPRDLHGRSDAYFESWFNDSAQFEIEYIADGGAYSSDYHATLAHPANAGKYKSPAAQRYYIRKGLRDRDAERADCGMLTGWRAMELAAGNIKLARRLAAHYPGKPARVPLTQHILNVAQRNDALWETIGDYGKLYQWGRGGRTLAPADLVTSRGNIKGGYAADMRPAAVVDFIRVIESFNRYVGAWCAAVPEMWREHCACEDAEELAAKRQAAARKGRETRERNYWAARDCATV